jgi:hypothetical protein
MSRHTLIERHAIRTENIIRLRQDLKDLKELGCKDTTEITQAIGFQMMIWEAECASIRNGETRCNFNPFLRYC